MLEARATPLRKRNVSQHESGIPRPMFMRRQADDSKRLRAAASSHSSNPPYRGRRLGLLSVWWQRIKATSFRRVVGYGLFIYTCVVSPLQWVYFGVNDVRGGILGEMVDNRMQRMYVRNEARARHLAMIKDQVGGGEISEFEERENRDYTSVNMELLLRRRQRQILLTELEQLRSCVERADGSSSIFPAFILQPNVGAWFRPRYTSDDGPSVIPFDAYDMRQLVFDKCPQLLKPYNRTLNENELFLPWSICAMYHYGGYVLGTADTDVDSVVQKISSIAEGHGSACADRTVVVFRRGPSQHDLDLQWVASSPRHPHLKCLLDMMERTDQTLGALTLLSMLYSSPTLWESSLLHKVVHTQAQIPSNDVGDVLIERDCPKEDAGCCSMKFMDSSDDNNRPRTHVKVLDSTGTPTASSSTGRVIVTISDRTSGRSFSTKLKVSIQERLFRNRCQAGWLCNRCLKSAWHGSIEACRSVCRECFINTICSAGADPTKKNGTVDIAINERRPLASGERRIPRVIHQLFSDELTVDRYPQLVRLQNSWQSSGWEYRFYTHSDARTYIAHHYPGIFLIVFDALKSSQVKTDLFRYLVLLRDGGIYADPDILLNANLDSFITPSMSFFAPRDMVASDHKDEFCVSNELIGAAPGHPILVRVAEQVLNRVLLRADTYDIEHELCRTSGPKTETWKIREWGLLFLSGSCALGIAINDIRGDRNRLARHELGWIKLSDSSSGDALILAADKSDMNALRFTDLDRSTIVASTGMIDLNKTPLNATYMTNLRPAGRAVKPFHYNQEAFLDGVLGTKGFYKDQLVSHEILKLEVLNIPRKD